jgi:hypothetical protein
MDRPEAVTSFEREQVARSEHAVSSSVPELLPAHYPRLHDITIFVSILSTIVYLGTSEGVAGFVDFVLRIVLRLLHYPG